MTAREQALKDIHSSLIKSISYDNIGMPEVWNVGIIHLLNRKNYFNKIDNLNM